MLKRSPRSPPRASSRASPKKCAPDEVLVAAKPQRCRKKSPASSALSKERNDIATFLDDTKVTSLTKVTSESESARHDKKQRKQIQALQLVLETLSRSPGYVANAVHFMRRHRSSIPDVHSRYSRVTLDMQRASGRSAREQKIDEVLRRSIDVKRAVFAILSRLSL